MIMILGGTYDARKLAEKLLQENYKIIYSVVYDISVDYLPKNENLKIQIGALKGEELKKYILENEVDILIDATHPYAQSISETAMKTAEEIGIEYLRFERKETNLKGIREFSSYEEMVEYLLQKQGNILLTTGSRNLEAYQKIPKERLFVRVLPLSNVIKKCEDLGYNTSQIIAMQGPFSLELNKILIKKYDIKFITTKDSGKVGGIEEKIAAANETGAELLVVDRPKIEYKNLFSDFDSILKYLK